MYQVETTIFCDVGINLHTKLAICLLLSTNQSGEWVAKYCGLLQVSVYTKRIENIYHFELSFGNSFWMIFQNLWNYRNMDNYVWTSISMLTFKKYCIWGLISTYINTPLPMFKREVRPIELKAVSTVFFTCYPIFGTTLVECALIFSLGTFIRMLNGQNTICCIACASAFVSYGLYMCAFLVPWLFTYVKSVQLLVFISSAQW